MALRHSFRLSYQIRIITMAKSLRLTLRGRKQSQGCAEIASYRRNDDCSTGFYILSRSVFLRNMKNARCAPAKRPYRWCLISFMTKV